MERTDKMSYSMIMDKESETKQPFSKVEPRKIYTWVNDSAVNNCFNCAKEFSVLLRRHHCRVCGHIFCYRCAAHFSVIPSEMKTSADITETGPVRLCFKCYTKVLEYNKMRELITVFELLDIDMRDFMKMRLVCKTWMKVSNYFLSRIREIHYYFPDHQYTEFERRTLWNNRMYFICHSKWLVQLFRSINVNDYHHRMKIINDMQQIITHTTNRRKICSCNLLMCGRHCDPELSAEDAICLLDSNISLNDIRRFAIFSMKNISTQELICYMPLLVHNIRHETIDGSIIGQFLINKARQISENLIVSDYKYISELYWAFKTNSDEREFNTIYKYYIDSLAENIRPELIGCINNSKRFIKIISNCKDDVKDFFMKNAEKYCDKRGVINGLTNPFDEFTAIYLKDIEIKSSATKPIQIPLKNNNETKYYLYKKEDIRKDKIIMNIIRLIDIILKREENIDLNIITYDILSISHNDGILEMVPNCDTIYNIKNKQNNSIINYIMSHNERSTVEDIKSIFMKSCAAYCVITYILGIGDRHLENIMITHQGKLFHIDYSYILGYDAKPITTPRMRITNEMVDALGGPNSKYYDMFKATCNITYNCLRRHIPLFINMLSLLVDSRPIVMNTNSQPFTKEQIKREIMKQFIPGENSAQAEMQLCNHIESSSKDLTYYITDFLHYHSKEHHIKQTLYNGYNYIVPYLTSFMGNTKND